MPVLSAAISVDGVLQKSTGRTPIPLGVALYHSLKSNFNILLYSSEDRRHLDYWLSIEAFNEQSAVEYNENERQWLTDPERKLVQLNSLRQRGFNVSIVIEPDPESAALMISNGFTVLNFIHSQYAMPQWLPDYPSIRPKWQDFADMANKLAEIKAMDNRLKALAEKDWE